jgi:hypothetical protein
MFDPSVNQMSPLTTGVPVPLVRSSLVNIVTLYLGSKLNAGLITSTPTLNMGSDCCVLDWDVGKTNFPYYRDNVQLILPHSVPLTLVGEGK